MSSNVNNSGHTNFNALSVWADNFAQTVANLQEVPNIQRTEQALDGGRVEIQTTGTWVRVTHIAPSSTFGSPKQNTVRSFTKNITPAKWQNPAEKSLEELVDSAGAKAKDYLARVKRGENLQPLDVQERINSSGVVVTIKSFNLNGRERVLVRMGIPGMPQGRVGHPKERERAWVLEEGRPLKTYDFTNKGTLLSVIQADDAREPQKPLADAEIIKLEAYTDAQAAELLDRIKVAKQINQAKQTQSNAYAHIADSLDLSGFDSNWFTLANSKEENLGAPDWDSLNLFKEEEKKWMASVMGAGVVIAALAAFLVGYFATPHMHHLTHKWEHILVGAGCGLGAVAVAAAIGLLIHHRSFKTLDNRDIQTMIAISALILAAGVAFVATQYATPHMHLNKHWEQILVGSALGVIPALGGGLLVNYFDKPKHGTVVSRNPKQGEAPSVEQPSVVSPPPEEPITLKLAQSEDLFRRDL